MAAYLKTLFLVLFFNIPCLLWSQKIVQGRVLDADKNTPLAGASVFLSNTSVGTVTSSDGAFQLSLPTGRFDLVISSVGYETYSQTTDAVASPLTVSLQPKIKELETVVVERFEKDGWAQWGTFFLQNFIGTSTAAATQCVLKNKDAVKFRFSKKENEITAVALEPLVIQNKALGYTVTYQLENFSYNFNTKYLLFEGFPFFAPMQGSTSQQKRWAAHRREAYQGSMLHFMRSLYRNKLSDEGFEVHALRKVPNTEKKRVSKLYQTRSEAEMQANNDSAAYYEKIMRQPDGFDYMSKTVLPGDSIAYAIDSVTAALDFQNYLVVIYKKALAEPEYRRQNPDAGSAKASQLFLMNNKPVFIQSFGNYYEPSDLLSLGYWSWSEKMATLLPFDYQPD